MPRTSTARGAAIAAAADLFRRQGYAATGLETILAASGAPKGSFYHHFPGGKEELAVESIAFSGDRVRELIDHLAAAARTPGELVAAIAAKQAADLRESGYERGCPVATVALELAGITDAVAETSSAAFERWAEPLADKLRWAGRPAAEARRLARWAVATLEGALLLARTARDASIVTDAAAITATVLDGEASPASTA
ncbi:MULTISPECIES: TetR/AcrR family transcriptional regulator [unclassified Frankia]|uniref:TetR/AcrR family transcriptional regulator n=1 Tax=unclassified Frankia TaxID=2632575 RepID=UPI0020245B07